MQFWFGSKLWPCTIVLALGLDVLATSKLYLFVYGFSIEAKILALTSASPS